jgi:hypothetical protein
MDYVRWMCRSLQYWSLVEIKFLQYIWKLMNIIPRASRNTVASWPLRLSTLRIRFIAFSPLGWLSIGLWSVVKQLLHRLKYIDEKIRLYYFWINIAPNHQHVVDFDRLWARAAPCPNIHAQFVQHVFLISLESQLSRSTSLYDHSKLFCGIFWYI